MNIAPTTAQEVQSRIKRLDATFPDLIPLRDTWSPVDEALYGPVDFFRVPFDEAQATRFKAIKYAFMRHYNDNTFYHKYCERENVRPNDIKTADDLIKIPLLPDYTFKQHPSGRDFAYWLATVFTGELPNIVIKSADPTLEDVMSAFKAAGIHVLNSSGTSGMMTFIPKDAKTLANAQYSYTKASISQFDFFVDHALMCFPNPKKTSLGLSVLTAIFTKFAKNAHYLMDLNLSAGMMQRAMSGNAEPEGASSSSPQSDIEQQTIARIVRCFERLSKTEETFFVMGTSFMLFDMMNTLQRDGQSFDFGERGLICTAGGWKGHMNARIPLADFRKQVQDVLGISETHCTDGYSMIELNECFWTCPEGHYRHVPLTHLKPFILDKAFTPLGYGERGRFAFLDALAGSYPGFIITSDEVRMLERCPACDRLGPVLEPDIQRAKGADVRGCGEVIKRALAEEGARRPH